MADIADILKRMDTYRRCLPISGQACLDELSDAIHDLKVENDNLASALETARETMEAPDNQQDRRLLEQTDVALAAYRSSQK